MAKTDPEMFEQDHEKGGFAKWMKDQYLRARDPIVQSLWGRYKGDVQLTPESRRMAKDAGISLAGAAPETFRGQAQLTPGARKLAGAAGLSPLDELTNPRNASNLSAAPEGVPTVAYGSKEFNDLGEQSARTGRGNTGDPLIDSVEERIRSSRRENAVNDPSISEAQPEAALNRLERGQFFASAGNRYATNVPSRVEAEIATGAPRERVHPDTPNVLRERMLGKLFTGTPSQTNKYAGVIQASEKSKARVAEYTKYQGLTKQGKQRVRDKADASLQRVQDKADARLERMEQRAHQLELAKQTSRAAYEKEDKKQEKQRQRDIQQGASALTKNFRVRETSDDFKAIKDDKVSYGAYKEAKKWFIKNYASMKKRIELGEDVSSLYEEGSNEAQYIDIMADNEIGII